MLKGVQLPVRANYAQIVAALLAGSSLSDAERESASAIAVFIMAKRARPRKGAKKDGPDGPAEGADDVGDGGEEEGEQHLDADVPDLSDIVVPDVLRDLAGREVHGNVKHVMGALWVVAAMYLSHRQDRFGGEFRHLDGLRALWNYQPYIFAHR